MHDPISKSVLIVDDNRDFADLLRAMLKSNGFSVKIAYDGLEAIEVAHEFQPNIAIVDITLPKLNGFSVARRLRGYSWGARMQLIAVTGWAHEAMRISAKEAGFDHYLTKPIDDQEIISLLTRGPRLRPDRIRLANFCVQ